MSPSVVPSADKPGNNSAVVPMVARIATAINGRGKCMLLSVPHVAKTHRYRLSHEMADRCTAATATPKLGAKVPI